MCSALTHIKATRRPMESIKVRSLLVILTQISISNFANASIHFPKIIAATNTKLKTVIHTHWIYS